MKSKLIRRIDHNEFLLGKVDGLRSAIPADYLTTGLEYSFVDPENIQVAEWNMLFFSSID